MSFIFIEMKEKTTLATFVSSLQVGRFISKHMKDNKIVYILKSFITKHQLK